MSLIDEANEAVKKFTDPDKLTLTIYYSYAKEEYKLKYGKNTIVVRYTVIGYFLEVNGAVELINEEKFNIFKKKCLGGIS